MTAAARRRTIFDWKAVLGILISIGLLYWVFRNEDPAEILAEIRRAHMGWFAFAIFLATFVFWIRAWRWRPLLRDSMPNASYGNLVAATTIGFMGNNLLPARIGEFARAYALARQERGSVVTTFASLVAERLFDAIAIAVLLLIALAMPGMPEFSPAQSRYYMLTATLLAVGVSTMMLVCALLVLWPQGTVEFFEKRIARYLPRQVARPFVDALEAFLSGLSALRSPRLVATVSFQTVVLWLVNALGFWAAFKAFSIDLPFSAALLLQSMIALFVSAPSGPGFFGLFESAASLVLVELYRIEAVTAKGFAIGFHLGGFIPVTVIGLYYAWRMGLSWSEVEHSEETVEQAVEREIPAAHEAMNEERREAK